MSLVRLARRTKYGAKPTVVDGIRFDSKLEAARWQELRILARAGEITSLTHHPRYPLFAPVAELIGHYEADFAYNSRAGLNVIEDCKGVMTPLAKWKIRHFEAQTALKVAIITKARRA